MKTINEGRIQELRQYGIKIESEEEFQLIKNRLEKVGECVGPFQDNKYETPYLVFGSGINGWFFDSESYITKFPKYYATKEFITSEVFTAIYEDKIKKAETIKLMAIKARNETNNIAKEHADNIAQHLKIGDKIQIHKTRGKDEYWMDCEIAGEIKSSPNMGYYLNVDIRNTKTNKIHSLSLISDNYRIPDKLK